MEIFILFLFFYNFQTDEFLIALFALTVTLTRDRMRKENSPKEENLKIASRTSWAVLLKLKEE